MQLSRKRIRGQFVISVKHKSLSHVWHLFGQPALKYLYYIHFQTDLRPNAVCSDTSSKCGCCTTVVWTPCNYIVTHKFKSPFQCKKSTSASSTVLSSTKIHCFLCAIIHNRRGVYSLHSLISTGKTIQGSEGYSLLFQHNRSEPFGVKFHRSRCYCEKHIILIFLCVPELIAHISVSVILYYLSYC